MEKKPKKHKDALEEVVILAMREGMTYAQFQRKESLGLAKIRNGKLLLKGRDY